MKTYSGKCHCGTVTFTVETTLDHVLACNCSHCAVKGLLLVFVEHDKFKILTGEDHLTSYKFNKKSIDHLFCNICGTQPFARGVTFPKVAINVRCLDGVDVETLTSTPFNGKDL